MMSKGLNKRKIETANRNAGIANNLKELGYGG